MLKPFSQCFRLVRSDEYYIWADRVFVSYLMAFYVPSRRRTTIVALVVLIIAIGSVVIVLVCHGRPQALLE